MSNGFQKTEIGLIPYDWELQKLGDLCEIKDGTHQTPKYVEDGVPFYSVENVTDNNFKNTKFISEEEHRGLTKSFRIEKGDILMTRIGSIGDCKLVDWDVRASFYVSLALLKPKGKIFTPFLFQYTKGIAFQKQAEIRSLQWAVPKKINLGDISGILVLVPKDIKEQTAIATALSDTDALIENLEKLIAKKRNIKQGVMNKIFHNKLNWVEKDFKKVCWFQEGPGLRNWQFTNKGIKVINVTNLENGYLNLERTDRYISLEEFNNMYKHFEIDENDIVVASSGNSYGKVAVVRKQDLPLVMNTSVIRFKPTKDLDYNFLLVFLKSKEFKSQIDYLITGGAQPNFGPAHLNQISIFLPNTLLEQKVIATTIMDIDTEIEALEQKLSKYRMIKQGMMQTLLTGKIRLV